MKKIILFLAFMALSSGKVFAQGKAGSTPTYYTTCTQVSISTSTPVELTGNLNNPRKLVWAVKATNLDSSANICLSQDPLVSCSLGTHHGEVVASSTSAPYNFLSWIISMIEPWYAISSGAASTNAEICLTQ